MERVARDAQPEWKPAVAFFQQALGFRVGNYGITEWSDFFTPRQLVALTTLTDLVGKIRERVKMDAVSAGMTDDDTGLEAGGVGATAYAEAVSVYLAFAVDRVVDYGSSFSTWRAKDNAMRSTMSRQALPMNWDFAEGSPFGSSSAGFTESVAVVARVLGLLPASACGTAVQLDAQNQRESHNRFISTDPPYYDNIGYADLSDFFYVWMRRSLRSVYPASFATVTVPKAEELVATPHRHGGADEANAFFLRGMTDAMRSLATQGHPAAPLTIYYAFKQLEGDDERGVSSTGWETFLEAVLRSGLSVTGTWPVRTEGDNRQRGNKANALASSVVLVCRRRPDQAPSISRRDFLREINSALPEALDEMTKGAGDDRSHVAPVDLAQAIIGPGMAIFSKYGAVLESDGTPMSVRTALQLINRFLAEDDFDPDTQFCLHWFEQNGWKGGDFGDADTFARAKGTSVDGVKAAGVVESGSGVVRLLKWSEYTTKWDPRTDTRNPVWETLHHLIRALKQDGETGAGRLLTAVRSKAEAARQLAYRLYTLCERQGWAEDARVYNEIITSWTAIESATATSSEPLQGKLF